MKIWLRFQRLARICGVVISFDNSSEKEGSYSLLVELGSFVWKYTNRIGKLLNH